ERSANPRRARNSDNCCRRSSPLIGLASTVQLERIIVGCLEEINQDVTGSRQATARVWHPGTQATTQKAVMSIGPAGGGVLIGEQVADRLPLRLEFARFFEKPEGLQVLSCGLQSMRVQAGEEPDMDPRI